MGPLGDVAGLGVRVHGACVETGVLQICRASCMCAVKAESNGHKGATAEEGPWLFTLDFPSYQPILTHAKNRCARTEQPC